VNFFVVPPTSGCITDCTEVESRFREQTESLIEHRLGCCGINHGRLERELPVGVRFLSFGVTIPYTAELEYGSP